MAHKVEIWGKERRGRTISVWKRDGAFDICRAYSNNVDGYTVEKTISMFKLHQTALVLGGSEMWSYGLNSAQTEALVAKFRKSAEKSGFTNFGIVQM